MGENMRSLKRIARAFSLIELMVAIAIVGILVSFAVPRFLTFIARARMSEAINNLGIIDRLQHSYNLSYKMKGQDNVWFEAVLLGNGSPDNKCDPDSNLKNTLGFRVEDCPSLRYDYSGSSTHDTAFNKKGHQRIYLGCAEDDEWKLHRQGGKGVEHSIDLIVSCK